MYIKFSGTARQLHQLTLCAVVAVTLASCGGGSSDASLTQAAAVSSAAAGTPAPLISGTPPTSVDVETKYQYIPNASEADGRVLAYDVTNKPDWATFAEDTGELSGTPQVSDIGTTAEIEIGVSNGTKRATIGPFRIRVNPKPHKEPGPPVAPPTIAGTPAATVSAGQAYQFVPTVTNPGSEALSFAIVNRPAWASFSTANGQLSGTPTSANVGSFANILISVTGGNTTQSLPTFVITVEAPQNNAPTITGTPAATVVAGASYSFTPGATDPDGQALTFSIQNAPAWSSFSANSGQLSGSPHSSDAGSFSNIVISVSDGTLTAALPAFTIAVQVPVNDAPTITGTPATSVIAGSSYSFKSHATDPAGKALTFAIQGMPSWASFSTASGQLSGTPTSANVGRSTNIVISVGNGSLTASLPAFSILVQAPADHAPLIGGTPPASVIAGTAYSFKPTASDPDGNMLTFSVSNLPSWATFSAASGQISGTPGTANAGSFANIVITVSDGILTSALPAFTITVSAPANPPPTISGTPATSVNAGMAYSFTPTAADPNHNALTFSIANLPSWAAFNAQSGTLLGTPMAIDVGTYSNISIRASDSTSTVSLASFSITVTQSANGSATLSWVAPTQNTDGSALTNLAGYHIYYGTSASNLNQSVQLTNPGLTTYVLGNLASGTWYITVNDYTTSGVESAISNMVSKVIP
jgi:hypothetical protein